MIFSFSVETSFPFHSVLSWLKAGRKEGVNNPDAQLGFSAHTLKLSPKDDSSSEGDSVQEDMRPTEAGVCLVDHRAPEGLECCRSRQLRGNEDPGEPMAWILLSITQPGKRLWPQATWSSRLRHLSFYSAHRG